MYEYQNVANRYMLPRSVILYSDKFFWNKKIYTVNLPNLTYDEIKLFLNYVYINNTRFRNYFWKDSFTKKEYCTRESNTLTRPISNKYFLVEFPLENIGYCTALSSRSNQLNLGIRIVVQADWRDKYWVRIQYEFRCIVSRGGWFLGF